MLKNVPSEFLGRFSIKRKRSSGGERQASTPLPISDTSHGPCEALTVERKPSQSSVFSSPVSYPRSDSYASSRTSEVPSELYTAFPADESDQIHPEPQSTSPDAERRRLYKEQTLAQDELIKSYKMLDRSAARVLHVKTSSEESSPTSTKPSPQDEEEIYMMLKLYSQDLNWRKPGNIKSAAKALVDGLATARESDLTRYVGEIIQAIRRVAVDRPQSIDLLLLVFTEAAGLFPESMSTEYGRGAAAGMNRFHAWLRSESMEFHEDPLMDSIAWQDLSEASSTISQRGKVTSNHARVLSGIEGLKRQRASCIVTAAMHGRAFALGMLRTEDGRHIANVINAGLRKQARSNGVCFICACILLRACGPRLFDGYAMTDREEQRMTMRGALEGVLLQDTDASLAGKVHAAVRVACDRVIRAGNGCAYMVHQANEMTVCSQKLIWRRSR